MDDGWRWRAIELPVDLDGWFQLQQETEAVDQPAERFDRDDLAEELSHGDHPDLTRDTFLLEIDGRMAAVGGVRFRQGAEVLTVDTFGSVRPSDRRRGIGAELLRRQLERAREGIAQRTTPGGAWRFIVAFEERLTGVRVLSEQAGLVPLRWFHDMERDLAQPIPQHPVAKGMSLAPWSAERDEQVRLAHNETFAGHWGSGPRNEQMWREHVTGHRSFQRDWSWVMDDAGEVAGYVLSQTFPNEWAHRGRTSSWIGLVGVRPAWRGRRLAPALLSAAMRSAQAAGMQDAALSVDADNASDALTLYSGLGFRTVLRTVYYGIEGVAP